MINPPICQPKNSLTALTKNLWLRKQSMLCLFAISMSLLSFSNSWAQMGATLERAPLGVACDIATGWCVYSVVNSTNPVQLNQLAMRATFPDTYGNPLPQDGDSIVSGREIKFNIPDQTLRNKFSAQLAFFDRIPNNSHPSPEIKFEFRAYALESSAYKNLNFGLSLFSNSQSPLSSAASRVASGSYLTAAAGSGISFNLGNLTSAIFGLHLDASRLKGWSMETQHISTIVTNGEFINAYSQTKTYNPEISKNSVNTPENANIGFNLSGKVMISPDAKTFSIENLSIRHAMKSNDKNAIATEDYLSRQTVPSLPLDQPVILHEMSKEFSSKSKGSTFIVSSTDSSQNVESTIIFVISASLVNRSEYAALQGPPPIKKVSDYKSMGRTSLLENLSQLKSAVLTAHEGMMSHSLFAQIPTIYLPETAISSENADEYILIEEENSVSGEKLRTPVKLMDLDVKGYQLKTIDYTKLSIPCRSHITQCQSIRVKLTILDSISPDEGTKSLQIIGDYFPLNRDLKLSFGKTNPEQKGRKFSLFGDKN